MKKDFEGLTEKEAKDRLLQFGRNLIEIRKRHTVLSLLISQFKNITTFILFLAAGVSLIAGETLDAGFIFTVLLVNSFFSFFQEYRAQNIIEKLKELSSPRARVRREGVEKEIEAMYVVPGDVVILREGDRIPADGKLLSSLPIEVDESVFSGESLPLGKIKGDTVFAGTFLIHSRGEIKVEKTGLLTRLGEVAREVQVIEKPKTPLVESIDGLVKKLVGTAFLLSLILLPIGVFQQRNIHEFVLTIVSLAVAVIPEGLPLVVTIALAVGAYRMARERTVVRKIAAIETLGATTIILADKTGTLTENRMSVKKYWVVGENVSQNFLRGLVLANTAELVIEENNSEVTTLGDKTDGALLLFVKEHVPDIDLFRNEGKIVREKPFDPETKIIEIEWKDKALPAGRQGKHYTFIRGAPETVIRKIGENEREKSEEKVKAFAEEGLRVIACAMREENETQFLLLGIIALYDPPRLEAKTAIEEARGAGVRIVMVTGDYPITAKRIAEEIGLIEEGDLVVTFDEIERLSEQELLASLSRIRIFARAKPEDKLRLVRLYKKIGEVVAVTGDGVNDALALAESHVGVAMGRGGTDVAREAGDLVITDDNIKTIVRAIEEGRGIFDNIVKAVTFLLSTNISEFLVISLGILLGLPIPLAPTQILWVNLVSDGLPALALATDIKHRHLLSKRPRNIEEQILSRKRSLLIAKIAIPFSLFLILLYSLSMQFLNENISRLILFNALVFGEMIVVFIVRGRIFPISKFLIFSILLSLLLQAIITVNPVLRGIFS